MNLQKSLWEKKLLLLSQNPSQKSQKSQKFCPEPAQNQSKRHQRLLLQSQKKSKRKPKKSQEKTSSMLFSSDTSMLVNQLFIKTIYWIKFYSIFQGNQLWVDKFWSLREWLTAERSKSMKENQRRKTENHGHFHGASIRTTRSETRVRLSSMERRSLKLRKR